MAQQIHREDVPLGKVSIFQRFTPAALHDLERRCEWRTFAAGEPILDYLGSKLLQKFVRLRRASMNSAHWQFRTEFKQNSFDLLQQHAVTAIAQIEPAPTRADIASRTSTHREAVAREFSRLAKMGILGRQGHVLMIKDIQRLSQMVHIATGE